MITNHLLAGGDCKSPPASKLWSISQEVGLVELLEDEERKSVYNIIDGLFAKKKLKDTLSNALNATL